MSEEEAAQQFPNDEYKKMDPEGNAAATIQHYYGDAGNGVSPKFYKKEIDQQTYQLVALLTFS